MSLETITSAVQAKFKTVELIAKPEGQTRGQELYLQVPQDVLVDVAKYLKNDPTFSFNFLSFMTSIDWKDRFEVVYYLTSTYHKDKVVLKVTLPKENAEVPTLTTVWPAADWQEREVFDLMGIRFKGHYNQRRILLPDDWEGHPLLKDYVAKPDRYD